MMEGKTNKEYFNELSITRLFFVKNWVYDGHQTRLKSVRPNIEIVSKIEGDLCGKNGYGLAVVDEVIENNADDGRLSFKFHIANYANEIDWWIIVDSFYLRLKNGKEDKYPFIYLLWFLNDVKMDEYPKFLKAAIKRYSEPNRVYLCREIGKICFCLPYYKQKLIKRVLADLKFDYNVYFPLNISEALRLILGKRKKDIVSWRERTLFDWVDVIINYDDYVTSENQNGIEKRLEIETSNVYICFCKWLKNQECSIDYQSLKNIYSLLSDDIQLNLIKRYFHDVRLEKTTLDMSLVEQFKDNKFDVFCRYRYCLETPEERINIGNKLLCDCILTLNYTGGMSFQTLDGVLDCLITHCDMTNPNIDLGLGEFLVKCNGGAIYNGGFTGFVDYELIVSFDESKLTEDNIEETVRTLLEQRANRKEYYVCKYDKMQRPLSDDSICLRYKTITYCTDIKCYDDKWQIQSSDRNWAGLFLENCPCEICKNEDKDKKIDVDWKDVSIKKMKDSIIRIAEVHGLGRNQQCIVKSQELDDIKVKILLEYSIKEKMRIYPREDAYMGYDFDLFNIKKDISHISGEEQKRKEFIQREANIVRVRVVDSLKMYLGNIDYNGLFFELPYDDNKLQNLLRDYYFKSNSETRKDWMREFLTRKDSNKCYMFCSPGLASQPNRVIGINYFWCLGKECFKNALVEVTLHETSDWNKYNIFHFAEILDYPKVQKTNAGYEVDEVMRRFISVVNKSIKKFKQLKCRSCGHIMFPERNRKGNFNRYNYYCCSNPRCTEFEKSVYLNYCFKCKKELIDSRDTKRCPNGWYICPNPDCLSCCSDEQYERIAQKYVLAKKPIPVNIQRGIGYGHNDKGLFYCPKCGWQLTMKFDKDKCVRAECHKCGAKFNIGT